jgi:hypothetical protein
MLWVSIINYVELLVEAEFVLHLSILTSCGWESD